MSQSNPDRWTKPRPYTDECLRTRKYGKIVPMEQDRGLLSRIFRRN